MGRSPQSRRDAAPRRPVRAARGRRRGVGPKVLLGLLGLALLGGWSPPVGRAAEEGEAVGRVLTLPAKPGPHTFWLSDVMLHRAGLFDADSGKLLGTIVGGSVGVGFIIAPLLSPDRPEVYNAESYFSRGIRGDRTDVVTIYDASTLLPLTEIPIPPKRAEYFAGVASSALSDDGRFLAVFNAAPAQSLTIVDVVGRRFTAEVESPACSLVYPAGPRRFFMLCANGDALVVQVDDAGNASSVTRTDRWFDPDKDPMTEKGARRGNEWFFPSFEGTVRSIDLSGATPRLGATWSLVDDADRRESWRVGGGQHFAIHGKTGRLYALMHQGGPDTHKEAGSEIWVYDLASHQRVQRIAVQNPLSSFIRTQGRLGREGMGERLLWSGLERVMPNAGGNAIVVTQDDHPRLIVASMMPPAVTVHDALSGEVVREVSEPGLALGLLSVP